MAVDPGEPEEPARDRPGVTVDEPGQAVRRARAGDRNGRRRRVRRDTKMSEPKFVPKTIYITYIASTPEKVWAALTSSEFTTRYFFGRPRKSRWQVCHAGAGRLFRHQGARGQMGSAAPAASDLGGGFRGVPGAAGIAGDLRNRAAGQERQGDNDRIPPVGCARRHPGWRPPGLAAHPLEPQERPGDWPADQHRRADGSTQRDDRRHQAGRRHKAVARVITASWR